MLPEAENHHCEVEQQDQNPYRKQDRDDHRVPRLPARKIQAKRDAQESEGAYQPPRNLT